MELRVLRYFLAVAREQSISGAAQALHVTQPTLSRQMIELEEELGVRLFHRGNRKISLTEQGMLLRKRAGQIVELVHKTEEELTAEDEGVSGTVYIAAGETRAFRALAESSRRLLSRHPDIRIQLFSGNAEDVNERLDKGLADFGVLIEPYNVSRYDYQRLPAVDVWGVIMRKDSPLARHPCVKPDDLRDVPLIFSRQAMNGGQLSSWFKTGLDKLDIVASYNLLYNASLLVEAGMGYVISLEGIINFSGDSGLCFRPLEPALLSNVDLVWKKSQVFSRASQLFLETLRQYINEQ